MIWSRLRLSSLFIISEYKRLNGYNIAQNVIGSHQQIYRELNIIANSGLIKARLKHNEGRPDSKIYSLTAAGERYIQDYKGNFNPIDVVEKLPPDAIYQLCTLLPTSIKSEYIACVLSALDEKVRLILEQASGKPEPMVLCMKYSAKMHRSLRHQLATMQSAKS